MTVKTKEKEFKTFDLNMFGFEEYVRTGEIKNIDTQNYIEEFSLISDLEQRK